MTEWIYIPVKRFEVQAVIGTDDVATPIEELVVDAIMAGVNTVGDVVTFFGLGYRPTLELIYGLWQRSTVWVDMESGEIQVNPQIAERRRKKQRIPGGERSSRKLQVMMDLVGGSIMQMRKLERSVRPDDAIQPRFDDTSYRRLDQRDVAAVANEIVKIRSRAHADPERDQTSTRPGDGPEQERRPQRVLELTRTLPLSDQAAGMSRGYLQIGVDVVLDEDSDAVNFSIEFPRNLGFQVRRTLETGLRKAAAEQAERNLIRRLIESARRSPEYTILSDTDRLLERMESHLAQVNLDDDNSVATTQTTLGRLASRVYEGLPHLGREPHRIEYHTSWSALEGELLAAITKAKRQLIVASPTLYYRTFDRFSGAFEDAIKRGVSVFVVWGCRETSDELLNARMEAARLRLDSPRFHLQPEPTRPSNASVLVADLDTIVSASSAMLGSAPDDERLFGLTIQSRPGACLHAAGDLVVELQPMVEHDVSVQMLNSARDFPEYQRKQAGKPTPSIPDASANQKPSSDELRLWREDWMVHLHDLREHKDDPRARARLLTNEDIKIVFREAVRNCQQRLFISARRIRQHGFDRRLADLIEARLDVGIPVVIVTREIDASVAEALEAHTGRSKNPLQLVENPTHSAAGHNLVIADDIVLATSYDLLGMSGDFRGTRRLTQPQDIALMLRRGEVAPRLAEAISAPIPGANIAKVAADVRDSDTRRAYTGRPLVELGAQLRRAGSAGFGPLLEDWFSDAANDATAYAELDRLEAAGVDYLRQAVAACLVARPGDEGSANERRRWYNWLVRHAWHVNDDAIETYLLQRHSLCDAGTHVPPVGITELCAEMDAGRFPADKILQCCKDSDTRDERTAAAAIGIVGLLRTMETDLGNGLDACVGRLAGPVNSSLAAAIDFWKSGGIALTAELVDAVTRKMRRSVECAETTRDFLGTLDRALSTELTFKLGERIRATLMAGTDHQPGYSAIDAVVRSVDRIERHLGTVYAATPDAPAADDEKWEQTVALASRVLQNDRLQALLSAGPPASDEHALRQVRTRAVATIDSWHKWYGTSPDSLGATLDRLAKHASESDRKLARGYSKGKVIGDRRRTLLRRMEELATICSAWLEARTRPPAQITEMQIEATRVLARELSLHLPDMRAQDGDGTHYLASVYARVSRELGPLEKLGGAA